jgi:hypothetical protein
MIQDFVIRDYYEEIERAKQPGYVSRYDDFDYEYTDAARSRPARFDQPHSYPAADQSHMGAKAPTRHERSNSKPHFRGNSSPDGRAQGSPPPAKDGFGAGIFP